MGKIKKIKKVVITISSVLIFAGVCVGISYLQVAASKRDQSEMSANYIRYLDDKEFDEWQKLSNEYTISKRDRALLGKYTERRDELSAKEKLTQNEDVELQGLNMQISVMEKELAEQPAPEELFSIICALGTAEPGNNKTHKVQFSE